MKTPDIQILEILVNHPNLDGFKILHLSDLHISKKTAGTKLTELVKSCSTVDYDVAVITGDIIDSKVKFLIQKLQVLNTLAYKTPVYYISGNHDVFYGLSDLKKELSDFIFLDNRRDTIYFNENPIYIVGIADRFAKVFNVQREKFKVLDFLQSKEATIFLAHQPKDYKLAVNTQTSLFLCGHTHGGQIFPFHYFVKMVQPFLNGLFYKNQTAIYVNKGLGTWGIDFRYKADSEITILELTSKSVK